MKQIRYLIQANEDGYKSYYNSAEYCMESNMQCATRYHKREGAQSDADWVKENICGDVTIIEVEQDERSYRLTIKEDLGLEADKRLNSFGESTYK